MQKKSKSNRAVCMWDNPQNYQLQQIKDFVFYILEFQAKPKDRRQEVPN